MRSLLPWIRFPSRDLNAYQSCLSQQSSELSKQESYKVFKLKTMCKHVSDYDRSVTPEQLEEKKGNEGITFYRKKLEGDSGALVDKMKGDKIRGIMEKAKAVNNNLYVPLIKQTKTTSQKSQLVSAASLNRLNFSLQKQNQSSLNSTVKTKFSKHSLFRSKPSSESQASLNEKLSQLKKGRQFRSKWFEEIKSMA